ncbi:hypothetical protein PENTCL1PPCAC_29295, partial [Pristionchus entomophagus]
VRLLTMERFFNILPISIPPIPLMDADRKEFSDADYVVSLWHEKHQKFLKNYKGSNKTSDTHNLRIKCLLRNTTVAAEKTLAEAEQLGMWPELREETSEPCNNFAYLPGCSTDSALTSRKEAQEDREKRMERRQAEMREYDRRMREKEAQEDKDEKDRERRILAHRMSQIRADQLKTMVVPKPRLLRPDKNGIRLRWERRAVK